MGSSLDLYFFPVARNHLSLGWSRSNSHYRSPRILDTRSEGSECQGRKAASPTLVSACTSTVPPPAGTLHQFEMQTDCGKAFTLTENRAPLGQWSKCVIAIYRQSAPSLSTPKKPKLHAAGIVSDLGDNAGAITQDVVTYCPDWPSTYLVARRPLTVLRERPTNPEFLI
jgi:hypothetical protein